MSQQALIEVKQRDARQFAETAVDRVIAGNASIHEAMYLASCIVSSVTDAFVKAQQSHRDAMSYEEVLALIVATKAECKKADELKDRVFAAYPAAEQLIGNVVLSMWYSVETLQQLSSSRGQPIPVREGNPQIACGYVVMTYVIKNPDLGLIKIGRTRDVSARIKALQTGAGIKLSTLAIIVGDIEKELHQRFADLRVFGEWFRDDGRIEEFASAFGSESR
jgi:hypothetical protein